MKYVYVEQILYLEGEETVTAAEVTAGMVVELPCGCFGQRATAPISAEPQFRVTGACDKHAPNTIVAIPPETQVTPI